MEFDDNKFIMSLFSEELKGKYQAEKKAILKNTHSDLKNKRQEFEKNVVEQIEVDQAHRSLLNMCVYPFTNSGIMYKTGFFFLRASPLYELGLENFDFLLFNNHTKVPIAIFGECKGSFSNANNVLTQMVSRRAVVEANLNFIKENYLHIPKSSELIIEYVIAVTSHYSGEMSNKVIELGGDFIVWHGPKVGDEEISIHFPPEKLSIPRERMMHSHQDLNRGLQHCPTIRDAFTFFPQMHGFSELFAIINLLNPFNPDLIDFDDLINFLKVDLYYMDEKYISEKAHEIIRKGLEIGFLEHSDTKGIYQIKIRGKHKTTISRNVLEKWCNIKFSKHIKFEVEKQITQLQDLIRKENDKQKLIFDFPK